MVSSDVMIARANAGNFERIPSVGGPALPRAVRPNVLLIFRTLLEESHAMLKGVAHFERTHEFWAAFHDDGARAVSDPSWLRNKRWHGIISRHTTPQLVRACAAQRIPLVDLNDTKPYPGVPKIRPDNAAIGHMGAEHFIDRGFRHLAFCGFGNTSWSTERRDGFVEAARLAGRGVTVLDVDYPGNLTLLWETEQLSRLVTWLEALPKPAAVMACHDMRAQQVATAADTAGILVPEEVAILGVNNDGIRCALAHPALSSVAPNAFQSGYLGASVLWDMIAGRKPKLLDQRVEPRGVVTRRSSDVLAIEDRTVANALGYIRENACREITVDSVAREVHSCRSQLERKFRLHIGRSPQAEIRRVQVERIRQLLIDTDYPLKRIAELSGFEHMEYMSVMFKRMTGETPGAYRVRVLAESEREDRPVELAS